MWYWVVTFAVVGGVASIVGLNRHKSIAQAVADLNAHKDYIDDEVLKREEGDIVNVEIVYKR
jgi:hypothetical protein